MLNTILAATETRDVPVSEAALYAVLGFAVVFVGIAFLIFVVWLVGKIMSSAEGKMKQNKKEASAVQELAPAVGEEELAEETVAVIMAALTAYYQTNNPKCDFTVKRIKRI